MRVKSAKYLRKNTRICAIRGCFAQDLRNQAGVDDGVAEFWKVGKNALRQTQPRLLA